MSRHRFVKNLDLDAEMEEEEEEEGMTTEQKAQMATSVPIARALLKDVKPPISDSAIADSLWHYWFDVDKAVTYLRRDWEKKGEATPPAEIQPTPEQQPRRRTVKRQRLDSPEIPLTALQRLSLARQSPAKFGGQSSPGPSSSTAASLGSSSGDAAKPKSKLAMLAEQRRLAAASKQAPETNAPAVTSSAAPSAPISSETSSPAKPLSKLAQKMAAARAAKAESVSSPSSKPSTPHQTPNGNTHVEDEEMEEIDESLFPSHASSPPSKTGSLHPSTFFSVMTTTHRKALSPPSNLSMHLPAIGDADELERRVRSAFGEGVESPDDIVLRARSGRAGTAALAPAPAIDSKT